MRYFPALAAMVTIGIAILLAHQTSAQADSQYSVYVPIILHAINTTPGDPTPTQLPADPAAKRAEVIAAVNAERQKVGCEVVSEDADLTSGAQAWADYMVANNYLNHSATIDADWYLKHGYTRTDWVSENIAGGPLTGGDAVALWMSDPPHKATVLFGCDHTNATFFDVGVGYNSYTWVLVIGELHT